MKNISKFRFTLVFFIAMLFGAANLKAAEYDLKICGVQVTDANKGDLTVINGTNGCTVTGIVNYNSTTNTLTLNGATIKSASFYCFSSQCNGLKIELIGNNTITANEGCSIAMEIYSNDATIQGSGTLNVSSEEYHSNTIWVYRSTLTIKKCTVNAIGVRFGIQGTEDASLIINGATVTAKGSYGSIVKFSGGITLNGCSIISPANAQIINGSVCDADGNVITSEVKIDISKYDLWICGEQVTGNNMDDLSVINGVTGTVSYNSDSKILTLNNANITIPDGANAIKSNIEGLTIDVQNNNSVSSNGWATMRLEKSTTISGSGTLNVSQTSGGWTVYVYGSSSLTIENCTVNATSSNYRSITGDDAGSLIINNATVTSKGATGSITHFANITLNGCFISKPVGAVASKGTDTFYAVRDTLGNIITDTVKIEPIIYYDLWICNVQVTTLNKDDLSVINGVDGSVSYNPDTKTLKLEDATICATGEHYAINTKIENLKIDIVGNNNLSSVDFPTVLFSEISATIDGSGTLNINATNNSGISTYYAQSLTIRNCTVNTIGKTFGFAGNFNNTLTIKNASVSAIGTEFGSICAFNDIELIGCVIVEPAGAVFNPNEKAVCDTAGNIIKDTVKILPIECYELYICNVQVNEINKDDLSVIDGVEGTVNYNSETRTLTLNNATITATSGETIISYDGGINIELIGDNTVTSYGTAIDFVVLKGQALGSIYGNGTLNATSAVEIAIESYVPLTIKNCTVNAMGKDHGIFGYGGKLTIDDATVSSTGTDLGSIYGFNDILLINCVIVEPAGAVFDNTQNAICVDGTIVNTKVKIEPIIYYNFAICDIKVSNANKNDLTVIDGVEGIVNYNPDTKTLRLENATINATSTYIGIYNSKIEGFIIELVGNNTVTTTDERGIIFGKTSTIQGSGTLNVNAKGTYSDAISIDKNTLTIRNCMVSAIGDRFGIVGFNGSVDVLNIENATVIAKGPNGSIKYLKELNLINCVITQPKDAVFNPNKNAVCDAAGNIIKDTVKIEPNSSIEEINAKTITIYPNPVQDILHIDAEKTITAVSIYNMLGSIVAQNTGDVREINISNLPVGIYMIRVEMGESVGMLQIIKE